MEQKGLFVILVSILFIPPLISAEWSIIAIDNNLQYNPSSPSLNLNHGQSQQIVFTVKNDALSLCSLQCTYDLIQDSTHTISQGLRNVSGGGSFQLTSTFVAPIKTVAQQDSGNSQYLLKIKCSKIYVPLLCSPDAFKDKETSVTLNYDLTPDEKNAKNYLQPLLSSIGNLLKNSESTIYTLNSKMNALPKSVLISDLKSSLNSYNSDYNSYKSNYDSTNKLYSLWVNTGDYLEAKNNLNPNLQNQLNQLNTNLNVLSSSIEERIKLHNEVTDNLNKLKEDSANLEAKAKLFGQDVSGLSSQVDSLESTFELGSFTSYSDIQDKVSSLKNQINSESSNLDKKVVGIIKDGNNLVLLESSKFNSSIQYSVVNAKDLEGIKNLCSQLSSIKSTFEQEDSRRTDEYNTALIEVSSYNENLVSINSNIDSINNLRKDISRMINKEGIKNQDYTSCQNELLSFISLNSTQLMNLSLESSSSCLVLNETLSELRVTKSNSFSFKIMRLLRTLWPFDAVKFAEIKKLEKKNNPHSPEILDFSSDSKKYSSDYCNLDLNLSIKKTDYVTNAQGAQITNSNVGDVTEHENQCTSFGVTSKCCEGIECADDAGSYPVIFLHGHSFSDASSPEYSLDAFANLQSALYNDKYRIGGVIRPSDQYSEVMAGEWGKVKFPITVKATYYYNVYSSDGKIVNAPSKQESIDDYAQKLKTVVELVKYRTGRNKVNIVAHSMGGLVARDYIKKYGGDSSVNKLIMVGTPNKGIEGSVVADKCSWLGADTECSQMKANSTFIASLNSGEQYADRVKYYVIYGSGCILSLGDGDGIVLTRNAQLDFAKNVKVNGKCEGLLNRGFHSNLLDSSKYPETYQYMKQFLSD